MIDIRGMWRVGLVAVVVSTGAAARADVDVRLTAVPGQGDAAPTIRATVIGSAPVASAAILLAQTDATPPITQRATQVIPYRDGGEPIAIAVVVEGHNLWMTDAMIAKIGDAIDAISAAGPPGSFGELVVYGNGARVVVPMGDLRRLDRRALVDVSAYQDIVTRDLASGIERATTDLRAATTQRKALILIGDGADTDPAAAQASLIRLHVMQLRANIDLYAIAYEADEFEGDRKFLDLLTAQVFPASSMADIGPDVAQIINGWIDDRFDAIFPGDGFTWDGGRHTFAIQIGSARVGGLELSAGPLPYRLARAPRRWPWLVLAGGVALLAFLIAVAVRRRRERAFATR